MPPINFSEQQSRGAYQNRLFSADLKLNMFTDRITRQINAGMDQRVKLAAQLIRDKAVVNVSMPVGRNEKGTVTTRSLPGEFPRVETARLMRDIFTQRVARAHYRIGTSLDYGVILETLLNRSFLRRTLREVRRRIRRILVSGGGGGEPPVFQIRGL